jgi:hypothetical protein
VPNSFDFSRTIVKNFTNQIQTFTLVLRPTEKHCWGQTEKENKTASSEPDHAEDLKVSLQGVAHYVDARAPRA